MMELCSTMTVCNRAAEIYCRRLSLSGFCRHRARSTPSETEYWCGLAVLVRYAAPLPPRWPPCVAGSLRPRALYRVAVPGVVVRYAVVIDHLVQSYQKR